MACACACLCNPARRPFSAARALAGFARARFCVLCLLRLMLAREGRCWGVGPGLVFGTGLFVLFMFVGPACISLVAILVLLGYLWAMVSVLGHSYTAIPQVTTLRGDTKKPLGWTRVAWVSSLLLRMLRFSAFWSRVHSQGTFGFLTNSWIWYQVLGTRYLVPSTYRVIC